MNQGLLAISLVAIWGAIIYFFYALNGLGIVLTLVLAGLSFWKLRKGFSLKKEDGLDKNHHNWLNRLINYLILDKINLALILAYLALLAAACYRFFQARSDRALISPWQVINQDFFWLYALSALVLSLILARTKVKVGLKISLIAAFYFLSFSAAAIVYKIGYGFDPFVHQATMELIAAKGAVLPKTPYYLGEYSLIIILSKISGLTIAIINKFLVPVLAALFLPAALWKFLKHNAGTTAAGWLTVLFSLVLTFSPFILTTPQNLSYLFLILAVLAAANRASWQRVLILSLAAAAIHPLSGLPAIALSAWTIWLEYETKFKHGLSRAFKALIWLFTALAIPTALFFSAAAADRGWGGFKALATSLLNLLGRPTGGGQEDLVSNFIYLLASNYQLLIILALGGALWLVYRSKDIAASFKQNNRGLVFLSSALLIAYLLSGQMTFDNVIYYEQSSFAARIPVAIMIFLLPSLVLALNYLINRILNQEMVIRSVWLALGLSVLCASLYISYPRFDKYFNSRGYSTSANDIAAVKSIESEAHAPYIALANQQVSAAALKAFGFEHYYLTSAGELYFYPIPTGSPLYQYYLDMVYKNPGRASMINAMDLAGVETGYLIVNKYWYQSGRVINEAKLAADKWWTINNEVYIFKYGR